MAHRSNTIEGRKKFRDENFEFDHVHSTGGYEKQAGNKFVRKFTSKPPTGVQISGVNRLTSNSKRSKSYKLNDTLIERKPRSRSASKLIDGNKMPKKIRNISAPVLTYTTNTGDFMMQRKDLTGDYRRGFFPNSSNDLKFRDNDLPVESWEKRRGAVSSFTDRTKPDVSSKKIPSQISLENSEISVPNPPPLPAYLPKIENVNIKTHHKKIITISSDDSLDSSLNRDQLSVHSSKTKDAVKPRVKNCKKRQDKFCEMWLSSSSSTLDSVTSSKRKAGVTSVQGYRNMINRINNDRNNTLKVLKTEGKSATNSAERIRNLPSLGNSKQKAVCTEKKETDMGMQYTLCFQNDGKGYNIKEGKESNKVDQNMISVNVGSTDGESDLEAFKESEVNYVEQFSCGGILKGTFDKTLSRKPDEIVIMHDSLDETSSGTNQDFNKLESPSNNQESDVPTNENKRESLKMHGNNNKNNISDSSKNEQSSTIVEIKSPIITGIIDINSGNGGFASSSKSGFLVPVDKDEVFAFAHEAARSSRSSSKVTSRCSSFKSNKESKDSTLPLTKLNKESPEKNASNQKSGNYCRKTEATKGHYFRGNIRMGVAHLSKGNKYKRAKVSSNETFAMRYMKVVL